MARRNQVAADEPPAAPAGEFAWNSGKGDITPTGETMEVIRGTNRTYTGFGKKKDGTYVGMEYATPWGAAQMKSSAQMMAEDTNAMKLEDQKALKNLEFEQSKELLGLKDPSSLYKAARKALGMPDEEAPATP